MSLPRTRPTPPTRPPSPFDGYRLFLDETQLEHSIVLIDIVEEIAELFRIEVVVHTEVHDLNLRSLIRQGATLQLPGIERPHRMRGLIAAARHEIVETTGISAYRFIIVPPLWLATMGVDNTIFQQMTATAIAAQVLSKYRGVPASRVRLDPAPPSEEHPEHEYVAQYVETDFDFLRRIFADEGLCFFYDHSGNGEAIITDDTRHETPEAGTLSFVPKSQLRSGAKHVFDLVLDERACFDRVTLRDFDYRHPRLPLEVHDSTPGSQSPAPLEQYEFGVEKFSDQSHGRARLGQFTDRATAERLSAVMRATCHAAAGSRVTVTGHPRSDGAQWCVVRSTTQVNLDGAQHTWITVPADVRYRPERRPRPRIMGSHSAVVVGQGEIDVDEHARVCVRFHWDRRDKATECTRRVRVSQAWAGPGYGFVCLPRVGDEVLVDFLDGDPDQPVVVGRVFNSVATTPRKLPDDKAISTWHSRSTPGGDGFNEIALDDAAGAERIIVHGERDLEAVIENDVRIRVGGHVDSNVKGNTRGGVLGSGTIKYGGDVDVDIGGDLTVHAANITASADGDLMLKAGGTRGDLSTLHSILTGKLGVISGPVSFVCGNYSVLASKISLLAGGSYVIIEPSGVSIYGPVVDIKGGVIKLNS